MDTSQPYLDGEAWEMRFLNRELAARTDSLQATSGLGRIAAAIGDAFELFGYDGMIPPFVGG